MRRTSHSISQSTLAGAAIATSRLTCTTSPEDLVRSSQKRCGNREAERLGGLEIDREIELRRLLHREIGWVRAFQDLVDVRGGPAPQVWRACLVGHETAVDDIHRSHRRQAALHDQPSESLVVERE